MNFRTAGAAQTIIIAKNEINVISGHVLILHNIHSRRLQSRGLSSLVVLEHDVRISLQCGKFYLLVPVARSAREDTANGRGRVCAIDPGVSSAHTVYSEAVKFGDCQVQGS